MSESKDIQNIKFSSLLHAFEDLGYKSSISLGQNEYRLFLNKKSSSGIFDNLLCNKLFEILSLDNKSTLSIKEFVEGFLIFEEEVARNAESFRIKFLKEKEIYNKILKQCELYKRENLNAEGFCKNAKISGEITDIDIRKKLEGLKEIIIIVIFNEKKEQLRFKIGGEASNIKKTFEFRPTSRKDHFEFVMKGLNDKNVEFDIGTKIFPLSDIASQEEYFVQIVVPEMDNPNQVAAYINANIILYTSDWKYYEAMLRKQEKRMNKYKNAANKAAEYLRYVREIYGDLTQIKPDLIVDFNNEKLMQRRGAKLNVNFNNEMEAEIPGGNFYVEFNNQRQIRRKGEPLKIEYNNSKEIVSEPIIETKKVEYTYKTTGYTSSVEKNISSMNKVEQSSNSQLIKTENNTESNINMDLINKGSIMEIPEQLPQKTEVKTQEEEIDHIKLYSDIVDSNTNSDENNKNINVSINEQEQSQQQQVYANNQIITHETKSSNQLESQYDLNQILQQQNAEASSGQYIQTTEQNGEKFDIDAFLKQNEYQQSAEIQNNDYEAYLQQAQQNGQMQQTTTTTTTTTVQGAQNQSQMQGIANNGMLDINEYQVEAKTLEPIVNKVGINYSVNKAIINETTNKILVSENTLPVSYLPEKVNKLIVSEQVTTLPLITAGSKVTYNTLEPIIHESKVYINEGSENNTNGYNFTTNNENYDYSNLITNNASTSNANYNYDINGQNTQNGIVEGNNYDYNFATNYDNNNWTTTQTSYNATSMVQTSSSQYNQPEFNFQSETQGIPLEHGEQIQYGI